MEAIKKLLDVAAREIGTKEYPPNSNKQKYGEAYGYNGVAWCVIFVWWCFQQAGLTSCFYDGGKIASCSLLRDWAVKKGLWVSGGYQPGDLVIFDFPNTPYTTDHIGIVEAITGAQMFTIEGNTSTTGSQSNGGEVLRKCRNTSQVIGAVRPKYPADAETAREITGEEIYKKLCEYLITQDVPDGVKVEYERAIERGITDGANPTILTTRWQTALMALRALEGKK